MAQNKSKKRKQAKAKARSRTIQKRAGARRTHLNQSVPAAMKRAAHWPVRECLVNERWQDPTSIAEVTVVRGAPGRAALARFLVDLQCLGVKDCNVHPPMSEEAYVDYRRSLDEHSSQPRVLCDPELGASIIQAGLDYAASLGFDPHPNYRLGALMLDGLDPSVHAGAVVCGGDDGKPLFIAGPYDNAGRIVAQLRARLGEDGFHFIAPAGLASPGEVMESVPPELAAILDDLDGTTRR